MANAAKDYRFGEEMEHRAWYFNDIMQALTEDDRTNRVHYFDDKIEIDTYHPLFKNVNNFHGTVRLTGALAERYKRNEEMQKQADKM